MSDLPTPDQKRLRMRAWRRGTREMDLILGPSPTNASRPSRPRTRAFSTAFWPRMTTTSTNGSPRESRRIVMPTPPIPRPALRRMPASSTGSPLMPPNACARRRRDVRLTRLAPYARQRVGKRFEPMTNFSGI